MTDRTPTLREQGHPPIGRRPHPPGDTQHTTPAGSVPRGVVCKQGRSVGPDRPVETPMMTTTNGSGRTAGGRFATGNAGGPGNPHAPTVAKLRAAILAAVTPEDIDAIVRAMIQRAKGGDLGATKELLDRVIGKPADADLAERLDALERTAAELREGKAT